MQKDLAPRRTSVVYPGRQRYEVGTGILVLPLSQIAEAFENL